MTELRDVRTSPAIADHSVTCYRTQVNAPALTPAHIIIIIIVRRGVSTALQDHVITGRFTRFTYPKGMEGSVDLKLSNCYPARRRHGRESNLRPLGHKSDAYYIHYRVTRTENAESDKYEII